MHGDFMIDTSMVEDHQNTNDLIKKFIEGLNRSEFSHSLLNQIYELLLKHIYIEENILFPTLPGKVQMDDIIDLEKDHGTVFSNLDTLLKENGVTEKALKAADELLGILYEHNAFEESFVYDYFANEDEEKISTITVPEGWKCRFCND